MGDAPSDIATILQKFIEVSEESDADGSRARG